MAQGPKHGDYYWAKHSNGDLEIVRIYVTISNHVLIELVGDEESRPVDHVQLLRRVERLRIDA